MSIDAVSLFLLASIALGLSPGPDNLFVLAQSSQHGAKAGLLVTLGLCTGLVFHTLMVALGVAVIFQTSELAFTMLKVVGAVYLLYLAWQSIKAKPSTRQEEGVEARRLYVRGIVMNVTNPKVAIFFLAFLPQFANSQSGNLTQQIILLGALFILATLFVFGMIAIAAGYLSQHLRQSSSAQLWLNRLSAVVFVGLAARLLIAER